MPTRSRKDTLVRIEGSQLQSKLLGLLEGEQILRDKSLLIIAKDEDLILHLAVTEAAMDLIDWLRKFPDESDDSKVVTKLSMRVFNSVASALSLMLSGYYQSSAMIMRDILETVFLLDYFSGDYSLVSRWRTSNAKDRDRDFKPFSVRVALDTRDGFTSRKREEMYKMFCDLASHPSPKGLAMLHPTGMDAIAGPFLDPSTLKATASELGRLAVQVGMTVPLFLPSDWQPAVAAQEKMKMLGSKWFAQFYSQA